MPFATPRSSPKHAPSGRRRRIPAPGAGPLLAGLLALSPMLAGGAAAQEEIEFASPEAATLHPTSASEEAVSHLRVALEEANNVNPAAAARHAAKALELDPDFGLARVVHAITAPGLTAEQRQEKIEQALAKMSRATPAEILLATAWRERMAGNDDAARQLARDAAEMAPADPDLAFLYASWKGFDGELAKGLEAMKEVTRRHPDFAPAFNLVAYWAWEEGDREGALEAVARYAELRPDHPNPHDSYAELLQWSGRLDEAAVHYRKAAEIDPDFDEAYEGLAEVLWLQGKREEARAQLEKAIEHTPSEAGRLNTRRALANTYLMAGDRKKAAQGLAAVAQEAEAKDIGWLAALAHRQLALVDALGDGKAIEEHLAKADALEPDGDAGARHMWAALAWSTAGEAARTREALEKAEAMELAPNMRVAAHGLRAGLLLEEDRAAEALAEIEKAEDDPPLLRVREAEVRKKMGEKEKAQEIKQAVLSDPQIDFYDPVLPLAVLRAQKI